MSYSSHVRRNSVGPRAPPTRGMVGGKYSQWILGDDTISGVGQGWVDELAQA